jgi:hypothetical protein
MSEVAFWFALAVIAYTYAGFPLLLALRAAMFRRPYREGVAEPTVSLVICAHDEARSIGARIENALALDYPGEKLEIVIASDGSSDGTQAIALRYAASGRVRVLDLPRRGKVPTLNDAVGAARGEVLVFSDANSHFERGALRALMHPFADPSVGGVAGDQRYAKQRRGESTDNEGERAYWALDRWIKQWQSAAGSVTSATGAIYAVRRELVGPIPAGVTDDFWVSTRVVAAGRRLVFAPDAVAIEPVAASSGAEFQRKVRVMTRGLTGVRLARELLDPRRHGFYALQLFSHKVLRRLVVLPLAVLAVATPFCVAEGGVYALAGAAQLAIYGAALAGWLAGERAAKARLVALPLFFCLVNLAAWRAFVNVLRGRRIDRWEPQRGVAA